MIILSWTILLFVTRVLEKTWWSPGTVFSLTMWISAVGTIYFAPEYYMSFDANIYLICLALLLSSGAMLGAMSSPARSSRPVVLILSGRMQLLMLGYISSFVSFVATLSAIGVGLTDLTSPLNVMRAAQAATFQRYTVGLSFPIYYNLANAVLLSYAMAITIHFVERGRVELTFLVPIFIYISSNMLITTRAPILFLMIFMIFTGVFAVYLRSSSLRFPPIFSLRTMRYTLIGALAIATVFFIFQVLRFGEESTRTSAEVWEHLRRWPWGSLPGFSLWFEGSSNELNLRASGSYTWMGLYDQLGIEERVVGGFQDYLYLSPTEAANIYTMFRGLYLDFGWVGSGLFMFCCGILGGLSIGVLHRYAPFAAIAIYVGISGLISFAFVVSFWAFTANIVALVIFPFLAKSVFIRAGRADSPYGVKPL